MKRFLVGLAIVGTIFASSMASAATLGVNGGTVQAGVDSTLSCDTDSVQVTAWAVNTIPGNYEGIDWVTISGVNAAACAGNDLVVRVDNLDGTVAYGGTYNDGYGAGLPAEVISSGKSEYKVSLYKDSSATTKWFLDPEQVKSIHVWIGGPTNSQS